MTDVSGVAIPATESRFVWVPFEDPTDVDRSITFNDINTIDTSCSMYTADVAASLQIEGIGGGHVDVKSAYMILDYVASRPKVVDGVAKAYGFGVRVVVKMSGIDAGADVNITGVVASAHANKVQTDVHMHVIGLSSPKIVLPTVTKLDIDGYAHLITLKTQIEMLLSLRDPAVVTLNPTVLAVRKEVPAASDLDILRSSYRLVAMRGIELGKSRDVWSSYMLGGTPRIKDQALFATVLAETYELNGIVDPKATPNASQIAAALEKTDGIYAHRKGYD